MSEKKSETPDFMIRYYEGKQYILIERMELSAISYSRLLDKSTKQTRLVPSKNVLTEEEFQAKLEGPHPYHVTW